jgi:DNA-binding MarR family transcriptional regulator
MIIYFHPTIKRNREMTTIEIQKEIDNQISLINKSLKTISKKRYIEILDNDLNKLESILISITKESKRSQIIYFCFLCLLILAILFKKRSFI